MKTKNITRPAIVALLLLIIPVLGNVFVNDFNWDAADFIVMGILIFGTGLAIELVAMKIKNKTHRLAIVTAIILTLLWLTAELAVGVFTNWGS